jgi:hypothetical protein
MRLNSPLQKARVTTMLTVKLSKAVLLEYSRLPAANQNGSKKLLRKI